MIDDGIIYGKSKAMQEHNRSLKIYKQWYEVKLGQVRILQRQSSILVKLYQVLTF